MQIVSLFAAVFHSIFYSNKNKTPPRDGAVF